MIFNNDGSKLYVLGGAGSDINEYSLIPDAVNPTTSLTAPADGATVSGNSVTISANASDDTAVAGVKFYVDGSLVGSEDTSSPYSITWNTLETSNGSKTIEAVARDSAGNTATSTSRTVTVSNDLDDFLVGHWKFDETTSGGADSVADSSGQGNHGTPTSAPSVTSVVAPASATSTCALTFDGTGEYVSDTSPSGFNTGTDARTISGWIRVTDTATTKVPFAYGVCGSGNDGKAFGVYLNSSETLSFWGCGGSYDFSTETTVTPDVWTHIAVTYDGTDVSVYKNGTLASTSPRTLNSSTAYWQVGSASLLDSGNFHFEGSVDDVRVYAKALSSSEITSISARTTPTPASVSPSTEASSATVSWSTDVLGSTGMYFGLLSSIATSTAEQNTGNSATTTHSVSVSSLPSCAVYKYRVVSESLAGDIATSTESTFSTVCTGSASITANNEGSISTSAGGTLTQGNASITVPTSFTATTSAATFQISALDSATVVASAGVPSGKNRVGTIYHLKSIYDETNELDTFDQGITVTLSYSDSDVSGLDESSLAIYRYDG
ncbi:hypothetical protein COU17_02710, partial [Candidatus Kaiserbacteria bacterium CG10_big_fil_rev_8_21_14_0_10_49_17]